jgi:glycosyltransferase involved in cell wall biosynthesis
MNRGRSRVTMMHETSSGTATWYHDPSPPPVTRSLSIVVIALQEGPHLQSTIAGLEATLPADAEILVVDDGSTDGSIAFLEEPGCRARLIRAQGLGVAGARNRGAAAASGEVLIFCDAHMTLPDAWWQPLLAVLEDHPHAAVAPGVTDTRQTHLQGFGLRIKAPELTSEWLPQQSRDPYPVPVLPGCTLAVRKAAFLAAGGCDGGMLRSQGIDHEFCLRWWLLGNECWIVPEIVVLHLFREQMPYELRWETVLHNRLRLALTHFDARRIALVVDALRTHSAFGAAVALAADSDVLQRRACLAVGRKRDVDWFVTRFGPEW